MNIEHSGLCGKDPISQALWYKNNLEFKIIVSFVDDKDGVAFMTPPGETERLCTIITDKGKTQIKYFSDSTCNGCGICEKVCLSRKIKMVDKKPVWQKEVDCYYCYACFNYCPEQAILVGTTYTQKNGRYHYPKITVKDIAAQK